MVDFKTNIAFLGFFGFFVAWIGMISGIFLSNMVYKTNRRIKGTILGFIGGLILALVCFDMLPESFEYGNVYIASFGITMGLSLAIILEGTFQHNHLGTAKSNNDKFLKIALFISIGIAIHNIPGGVALGALVSTSLRKAMHLSIIIILHGISEGLSIGFYLKNGKSQFTVPLLFSMFTALPMGIGAILGGYIGNISSYTISISLSFAGGLILYVVCREILPEAREVWEGRLSTIGNVLGVIAGILIISLIH